MNQGLNQGPAPQVPLPRTLLLKAVRATFKLPPMTVRTNFVHVGRMRANMAHCIHDRGHPIAVAHDGDAVARPAFDGRQA